MLRGFRGELSVTAMYGILYEITTKRERERERTEFLRLSEGATNRVGTSVLAWQEGSHKKL